MNTIQIEELLERLVQDVASGSCTLHDFPFRLMEAYDSSRNEVAKLRMKHPAGLIASDIVWPKKMLYRPAAVGQVQATVDNLKASLIGKKGTAAKNAPRFVVSTDGDEFLAFDTKTTESPGFDRLADLPVNYDYLLPMFGVERYKPAAETTADVRAARHMAKFFDAILDANLGFGVEHAHDLNVFMTRILFCMFAEDTGIFKKKLFVEALRREAQNVDGTDTRRVIEDIFIALNIPKEGDRSAVRSRRIATDFEYVNGGLFKDRTIVPEFNRRARRLLLEAADLQWDQIHADIFGSMIQAVVHTDMRADFGMHYTSVPNIMKVLEPLFLSSLREQLTTAGDSLGALGKLVDRISRIQVFDPACGSGNFLIIAYRELRRIETEAFRRIRDMKRKGQLALPDYHTGIKISSFHGIDPIDFACETAKLSLWISQYQMNQKLGEICASPAPALPLTDAGSIRVGNALRVPWTEICPPANGAEIFIVGNPPYLGRPKRTAEQQDDMDVVFSAETGVFGNLDYVAAWFARAADFGRLTGATAAFVTTNSLFQGEQVPLLWPLIHSKGAEYGFCYEPFRWSNSAAKNAGVICVIVGLRPISNQPKSIFTTEHKARVTNVNPYLVDAPDIFVERRSSPISSLPQIELGSAAKDASHLSMSFEQMDELLGLYPQTQDLIRPIYGAQEYLQGDRRYCLWIKDNQLDLARSIPPIAARLQLVADARSKSSKASTAASAKWPHRFNEIRHRDAPFLLIPRICSERRSYLPCGFLAEGTIATDQAFVIYDAPTWIFSVISSRLHLVWTASVAGRLKTDYRYSNTLVYNTFPLPTLSDEQKRPLEDHALEILRIREPHITDGRSLGWLYNPDTMPAELSQAHRELDEHLEAIYIGRPFRDDTERLEHLFKLYARMTKLVTRATA
ncbi:class I SAM-dependent DNA methyltransferase [Sphingomonas sp. CFBP 8760]|uniref:class I SAM-dependent DNA methyltransferase n=1 Tax=Sphingomonas sp. CFBP 8760 TaxID=2775282 RepID=UPI00177E875C|nr:class I SAM-dependent DNA methyltransferase [Sphingomonas sp. CFBP 8760]MBD8546036.1 class I SAM-dependent DNA methyltransferase [Sphingomonas sp. CFBP 8760]